MQWLVSAVYLLILASAHGRDEEATDKFCSAIHDQLQELKETTEALCGTEPDIGTHRQLATWTPVHRTLIGRTNFRSTGTLSYEIPDIVPDKAREVLIFAFFYASFSSGSRSYFKIYTEGDNGEDYAKYMALRPGHRSYYYTSTDNLWFPMTSSRRIFVYVPYALGGRIGGVLNLIGYR